MKKIRSLRIREKHVINSLKDTVDSENKEENQLSSLLAVSSRDKTVSIWNLKDATKMAELKLPSGQRGGYKSGKL